MGKTHQESHILQKLFFYVNSPTAVLAGGHWGSHGKVLGIATNVAFSPYPEAHTYLLITHLAGLP